MEGNRDYAKFLFQKVALHIAATPNRYVFNFRATHRELVWLLYKQPQFGEMIRFFMWETFQENTELAIDVYNMAVQARYFINGHRYASGERIRIRGDREIEACEIDYDDQVIINIQAPTAPPLDNAAEILSVNARILRIKNYFAQHYSSI
uniref:Galectin n=2 Tax=Bursaphelenchus xylophilus TaxID=6326 RepID=A0A1I7SJZ7_BURXY